MIGCIQVPRGHIRGSVRVVTRAVMMVGLLAGCSSVPDAVNPVEWYKGASDLITGKDRPEVASPRAAKGEAAETQAVAPAAAPRKEPPAKGLVADRGNAKYAQSVPREVTATKPLARRTPPPAAAETQVAAAAPAAPTSAPTVAPTVTTSDLPPAPVQVSGARDQGPSAPPATLDTTPPARPDIPDTVALPGQKLKPVHAHYQKRLAESGQGAISAGMVDMPGQAPQLTRGGDEPIHLIPPSRKRSGSGGKGLAAPKPQPSAPAASFQVAALDFRGNSSELTRGDRESVAEVARLYRQSGGGIVRIVASAPAPAFSGDAVAHMMGGLEASMKRANAVARELTRRGVPGHKIMIGADPAPATMSDAGAKVFLDVI